MRTSVVGVLASILVLTLYTQADDRTKDEDRLRECGSVLKEILDTQDIIPQRVLEKAECVLVFPHVEKAALGLGASYGRGAMTCRQEVAFDGPWGAPVMMKMEGLSLGFQLGAQASDIILLVMNDHGGNELLSRKIKLGADVTATAGPEERDSSAESDANLRAEIYTYARSRGLFAGVSLAGSTVRSDNEANLQIYGQRITPREISGRTTAPPSANELISTLTAKTPNRKSWGQLKQPFRGHRMSLREREVSCSGSADRRVRQERLYSL